MRVLPLGNSSGIAHLRRLYGGFNYIRGLIALSLRTSHSRLLLHVILGALCFWVYHCWLASRMQSSGLRLGAVSHKLAPLYAYERFGLKTGLLVAVGILSIFAMSWKKRIRHPSGTGMEITFFMTWMVIISVAVAGIDGSITSRLGRPFEKLELEYYGAINRVQNPGNFIRDYPNRLYELPMHAQTHPPGAVLFLWAVTEILGHTPLRAAWGVILFSSLSIPAVYLFARDVMDRSAARVATGLYVLLPNVVLFTATSMDGPFSVPLIWSTFLGWKAICNRSYVFGFLTGLMLGIATFMTFSASVVGLLLVFLFLHQWIGSSKQIFYQKDTDCKSLFRVPLGMFLGGMAIYVPLYVFTGYDPFQMLGSAMEISSRMMGVTGHLAGWQYFHISVANVVVFFFSCGLTVSILWLYQFYSCLRVKAEYSESIRVMLITFSLTLTVVTLLPLYVLETERIWIFLTPLVVLPATAWIRSFSEKSQHSMITMGAGLLMIQTILTETVLDTYW